MNELQIDEKNITGLVRSVTKLMKEIVDDIEVLENKKADIFHRYTALHRLGAMFMSAQQGMTLASHAFRFGFDVHHPFFQTPTAKEFGWDEIKLERNPFFIQEDDEKPRGIAIELKDVPQEVKDALARLFQKVSKEKESNVH